jgi:hypothetical protein
MPFNNNKRKLAAAGVVFLALLAVPAPLLPPHRLAEAVQSAAGISWETAYLVAAILLRALFYGSLGLLGAFVTNPASSLRRRALQIIVLPLVIIGVAVTVRSIKMGHLPMLANFVIPSAACLVGVLLGIGVLYRRWKQTLIVAIAAIGVALWAFLGGASAKLSRDTETHLLRIVASSPSLPSGETRFGALLQAAFAPLKSDSMQENAVEQNRAAILALGIAIGHERIARYVGLDARDPLVRKAILLREGTSLHGREDWPRHYTLSAALAVLEHPLVSDAAGLIKEELDALSHGSGYSFGDLAADRAGVRFAQAATHSEADAGVMQSRLRKGFNIYDFFPPVSDLPENLTVEQFRRLYGGIGSQQYRRKADEIEARLDQCPALLPSSKRQ